jgi:hypothetical protein
VKNHSRQAILTRHAEHRAEVIDAANFHDLVKDWWLEQMLRGRFRIFSYLRLINSILNRLILNIFVDFSWLLEAHCIGTLPSFTTFLNFLPFRLGFDFPLGVCLLFGLSFQPFFLVSLFLEDSIFLFPRWQY